MDLSIDCIFRISFATWLSLLIWAGWVSNLADHFYERGSHASLLTSAVACQMQLQWNQYVHVPTEALQKKAPMIIRFHHWRLSLSIIYANGIIQIQSLFVLFRLRLMTKERISFEIESQTKHKEVNHKAPNSNGPTADENYLVIQFFFRVILDT